ncbi:phosphatase PAP2 family protein [Actinomadura opuntiae]|uniref:phosphatase PAP2 family protein n=1 Tax=Actinomadura sp. OS1-43 TaxID=604315 RepID=UPI00255A7177|nr:phosphatase PAP2 family protein [Actinomadura sp. OS1-43]MDL4821734.1 phosphatase PAP2 family protein [Actinomadura sp. OS1-43]
MQAPDISVQLYRDVTEWAWGTPSWVHSVADVGTNAGLLLFAVLFVAGWWRARSRDARSMGLALAAPFAMVAAYLVSEVSKDFLREERPCRAVAGAVHIAACPSPGDWSFPSNHATIAAASAAVLVVVWRALAPLVLPLAALMAFSRVFVGVHYPHDVAAGFCVGVVVAPLVALVVVRLAEPVVDFLRGFPAGAVVLGARPAVAGAPAGGLRGVGAVRAQAPVPAGAAGVTRVDGRRVPDAAVTMPDVMGGVRGVGGVGGGRGVGGGAGGAVGRHHRPGT